MTGQLHGRAFAATLVACQTRRTSTGCSRRFGREFSVANGDGDVPMEATLDDGDILVTFEWSGEADRLGIRF
jgi:hypothetical protein